MKCPYCEMQHVGKCALVKAFEYHPDGMLKRVEFYAPSDHKDVDSRFGWYATNRPVVRI